MICEMKCLCYRIKCVRSQGGGVGPSVRKCEKGEGGGGGCENPPKKCEIIFERSLRQLQASSAFIGSGSHLIDGTHFCDVYVTNIPVRPSERNSNFTVTRTHLPEAPRPKFFIIFFHYFQKKNDFFLNFEHFTHQN